MKYLDNDSVSPFALIGWVCQRPESLVAWVHALALGHREVAEGMLQIRKPGKAVLDHQVPISFETHLEAQLSQAESLLGAVRFEGRKLQKDLNYAQMEQAFSQAMSSYVRTFLGFVEIQTSNEEVQYCTAALALESRVFRHYPELIREISNWEAASLEADLPLPLSQGISQSLRAILDGEIRHARTAQALMGSLPHPSRGIYRGVRAFEEMLYARMCRRASVAIRLFEQGRAPRACKRTRSRALAS